ncbi:DNA-binding transcriptional regulator YhcF (GntR family) [Crossiella equi]|uniref:DNA-binding transcriptional regulator YhcF (GntR family) n=1 Tax=Crossiella equi TaxID=130796 RepID=A0ABS5A843_9PSEU|nr:GntR family transcriptional regulator [Crossiella equi]MBP2472751.1 DNA-binding transcriptional regulator YhcF (GntR family) [Crossiella equi]
MAAAPLLKLDPASAHPPWRQLHDQVRTAIASGALAPGMALPTVRGLAADLGIAAGTVARAYKELEAAGVVRTAGRKGTVIADHPPAFAPEALPALAETFVREARLLGADRVAVFNAVNNAWPVDS